MTEERILAKLKEYLKAFYQKDFSKLVTYFYKDDLNTLRKNIEWLAKEMQPFGENEGLFRIFSGVNKVEDLSKFSDEDFLASILKHKIQELPLDKMIEMVQTSHIQSISHAEYIATVVYSMENTFAEDGSRIESTTQLILSEGEWYFLFKAGFENALDIYKKQIEKYNNAKLQDRNDIAEHTPDDEIERFAIYGYRNYNEDVIIEPRYKDAGEFRNGLAPVKIFSKWGYIDKYGEIVIVPNFHKAEAFSKKRAKVARRNRQFDDEWGVINTKGKIIVPLEYLEMNIKAFSDGMIAVRKDGFWGFFNKKGKLVIEYKYREVTDFEQGKAQALYIHKDGEHWIFYIDKTGKELGEVPQDEVEIYYEADEDDEEW